MSLADDIRDLRRRTLAELTAAHDYHAETSVAWDLIQKFIIQGEQFEYQNPATGSIIDEAGLAERAGGYVRKQLAEATFQQFLAIFEHFILELLALWLTAYPRSLGRRTVEFRSVLDLPDRAAIIDLVVRKELNEVLYDRPGGWFGYLEERAGLGCPAPAEVDRIAEAKATRDLLAHNRGIANATYERKAGPLARQRDGEEVDLTPGYHRGVWELLRKVVGDVADAAIGKAARPDGPDLTPPPAP